MACIGLQTAYMYLHDILQVSDQFSSDFFSHRLCKGLKLIGMMKTILTWN